MSLERVGVSFLDDDDSLEVVTEEGRRAKISTGGSQSGFALLRGPFEFAFNTPGLLAGIPFYTPTPGEFLTQAWVITDTAWNGTTPLCDLGFGPFGDDSDPFHSGLYDYANGRPIDMTLKAFVGSDENGIGPVTSIQGNGNLMGWDIAGELFDIARDNFIESVPYAGGIGLQRASNEQTHVLALLPMQFNDATPLQVCVSTTGGTSGGGGGLDPGSSAGAARLYIETVTPVAFE